MAAGDYSVKINRREGVVEITGSDKDWIAAQLDKLAPVFEDAPAEPRTTETRQEDPKPDSTTKRKATRSRTGRTVRAKVVPALQAKLTAEVKKKLADYVKDRQAAFDDSLQAQAAIIATFLQDELDTEKIDANDLYTVYNVMGWQAAGNPRAQLNNAKDRNGYFGGWSGGKIQLAHTGENFGRHGSKGAKTS